MARGRHVLWLIVHHCTLPGIEGAGTIRQITGVQKQASNTDINTLSALGIRYGAKGPVARTQRRQGGDSRSPLFRVQAQNPRFKPWVSVFKRHLSPREGNERRWHDTQNARSYLMLLCWRGAG